MTAPKRMYLLPSEVAIVHEDDTIEWRPWGTDRDELRPVATPAPLLGWCVLAVLAATIAAVCVAGWWGLAAPLAAGVVLSWARRDGALS